MWRIPCVFPDFLWNKGFSARSFWCFHADAHVFFRGFGGLNPSIIGVEGVFSAGVFCGFFFVILSDIFPFRDGRCRTRCLFLQKISVKRGAKQCGYYLISWGRRGLHGDYFISYDILFPNIEGCSLAVMLTVTV